MIQVTTSIHKSGDPANDTWRIHICAVDFGTQAAVFRFSPAASYPSAEAALAASRIEALEKIRALGHIDAENEIVWKHHVIS
ncbi:MAG: hypothetical protein ABW047_07330 [Nitrospiraceae bacterium]